MGKSHQFCAAAVIAPLMWQAPKRDAGRIIGVEIPIRAVSEMNRREHWAVVARRAKLHRESACWALMGRQRPELPCTVILTRIAPRELDGDNLQSSLKATRDGVADWLGVNDRDPRVAWRYRQQRGQAREYAVRVEIVPRGAERQVRATNSGGGDEE